MNIKRALFALLALMLLPAVAFAQVVTPADGTANIVVYTGFTDGNNETPVEITLNCVTGNFEGSPVALSQPFNEPAKIYVIDNIGDFDGNVCTVTQSPVDGYETRALCEDDERQFSGTEPDFDCSDEVKGENRIGYCEFGDVSEGEVGYCTIDTKPLPVKVKVTKEWDISGIGGNNYNRNADFTVYCDSYIVEGNGDDVDRDGQCFKGKDGLESSCESWQYFSLTDKDGVYEDKDDVDVGMATVTVNVIPEWYPTVKKPTVANPQLATECKAYETDVDSAVEVDESDCVEMPISVDNGNSCTIVNTVFFEGIPTLNQYGMAIMALLMLGVGFVGFRRFV